MSTTPQDPAAPAAKRGGGARGAGKGGKGGKGGAGGKGGRGKPGTPGGARPRAPARGAAVGPPSAPTPDAIARARAALGRRVGSAVVLAGFLALLYELDRRGLAPSVLRMAPGAGHAIVYLIVAATALACALAPAPWRRWIHVGAAIAAWIVALRGWAAAPLGLVALVIALARAPGPVLVRAAVVLAAWVILPIARIYWLAPLVQAQTILVAIAWTGLLYSAFYLLVERARALRGEHSRVVDDAFYLLALPRLVVPFFQPISPTRLLRSERPGAPWRALGRALGLAAWGVLVAVIATVLDHHIHEVVRPWRTLVWFIAIYARLTYTIFLAVAVFRLLGFDLPSGYRYPYVSRSFAEFFRRFNFYVRDAVLSLFYFPILGHLRLRLSARWASIVSAYLAIILGSFLLHDVLVPMAISVTPRATALHMLRPARVIGMLSLWSLIILPTAGIAPRREPDRSWRYTVAAIAGFNVIHFVVWYLQNRA